MSKIALFVALTAMLSVSTPGQAQVNPASVLKPSETVAEQSDAIRVELPASLSAEDRDRILQLLAIQAGPALVVDGLDKPVAGDGRQNFIAMVASGIERLGAALPETAAFARSFVAAILPDARFVPGLARILGAFSACVLVGLLIGGLVWLFVRRGFVRQRDAHPQQFSAAVVFALSRLLLGGLVIAGVSIGAIVAFKFLVAAGPIATASFFHAHEGLTQAALVVWTTYVVLSPGNWKLRLIPATDHEAGLIFRWAAPVPIVSTVMVMPVFLAEAIGATSGVLGVLTIGSSGVIALVKIAVFLRLRVPIRDTMRRVWSLSESGGGLLAFIANTWHAWFVAASVAILALSIYAELSGQIGGIVEAAIATQLLLIALPLIAGWVTRMIRESRAPDPTTGLEPAEFHYRMGVAEMLGRSARILVWIAGAVVLATLWGIDLLSISQEDGIGSAIVSAAVKVMVVSGVAWLGLEAARLLINRRIEAEGGDVVLTPGDEGGGHGTKSRLTTLLPLLRMALTIVVVIVAGLVVLSTIGIDIAPLLAGAGVVGLAIGFGAQTLVRDVISGVFFLIDDAFRKGEYIDVGSVKGTVEKISIRSFQLRHHNGPLHTIPFGEIQTLTNYSRDWAIIKFEIRLPFETDIEKVRKIVKQVGKEMIEDEILKPMMLEPLKSQGVNRIDDSALIIRCKFMAVPGQQFLVRREAFTRLQRALAENNIHFAPKRVLVETAPSPSQSAANQALAAAAAGALDMGDAAEDAPADDRG